MVVVAGPPGSGKSTLLRTDEKSLAYFNADERARQLNQGSGHNISLEIRAIVNQELESFIVNHIRDRQSFAYQTTLRTTITYEQARLAKAHGFQTSMEYVALASVEEIEFESVPNEVVIRPRQSESAKYMKRASRTSRPLWWSLITWRSSITQTSKTSGSLSEYLKHSTLVFSRLPRRLPTGSRTHSVVHHTN
jgi:dephospho-CoA kinase